MMSDDEIVRALRCVSHTTDICGGCGAHLHNKYCHADICNISADLIESLQSQLADSQRREQAAKADLKEAASELTGIGTCVVCRWGPEEPFDGPHCGKCTRGNCQFEWRGPQEAG